MGDKEVMPPAPRIQVVKLRQIMILMTTKKTK